MAEFADYETFPTFPVYILTDVSASLGAAIEEINAVLPELKRMLVSDPIAGEMARVGIMTFSASARVVLPLSDLQDVEMPILSTGSSTNFTAAFRLWRTQLPADIEALGRGATFYRPVGFFISDGRHNGREHWADELELLTDPTWRYRPEIVAFGFGAADPDALARIATRHAFMATDDSTVEQLREIMSTLISSVQTVTSSLGRGEDPQSMVEVDHRHFRPIPVQEV